MGRDRGGQTQPIPVSKQAEATVDTTDGPSVEITKDGPRAVRTSTVKNLKGNGAARLWFALTAHGVPQYGDLHPVIEGLPVGRVHAALASEGTTDIAIVTTEYFYPTGGNMHFANVDGIRDALLPQLEIASTVQPARTQNAYWKVGPETQELWQPLWLKYRDDPAARGQREGIPGPFPEAGPYQYQGGDVEYQLPMMVFRYTRREPSDAYIGDKARKFVGTINDREIFGRPNDPGTGDPERTWLCSRIDGVSDDGGATYNVIYEFQYNADTWDPVVVFTDPETGKPVDDPVWGESLRQVRVYKLTNFFELGLEI